MLTTKENFKGNNKLLVGIVLAVLSFWLFAQSILNMGPDVQSSLGISSGAMDIGVSSTALFSGLFIVVTGGLADKLGRVKFTFIGLCLNIIGSLLIVLANGAVLFIMGRIFQGLAAAFIMPSTMALVKTYYDGKDRQRAVSFWSIGSWGGSGLCSYFGGAVASTLGWRYVFIFSIIASVVSFLLILGTPESKNVGQKTHFDYLGLIIFIISMLSLNIGISMAQEHGLMNVIPLSLFTVMLIGFVLFYYVETRKSNSFIDFHLFENRFYLGATIDFLRNKIWYNSSMNYEASKQLTDVRFKRLVGVQRTTFEEMLAVLKTAYQRKHAKGGRTPKLSLEDLLMATLQYMREYRTYEQIAADFGIHESNLIRRSQWVESTLIQS
ncbi:quinolone resistance protein NorB, partial [Streptococcus agalactiae CCUG 44077]